MNKQEFERLIPIAINHPAYGPCRLELKRYKKDGSYIYNAQYRSNNWGCSYGTSANCWERVYDELSSLLKKEKII
jgi:hypothetical protein